MKKIYFLFLVGLIPVLTSAQTTTDGLMMPKKNFCTGFMYTHDKWTNYWEGNLKRENGNIGSITTQSIMWFGNYGITDKINVMAMVPYVMTKASQGTLHPMEGVQDLSVSVKYNFFKKDFGDNTFKTFVVGSFSTPLTDYTPDFLPLSIGMASTTLSGRLTANYRFLKRWFVNGSTGYTFRSNVKLDRPSYYTNDQLYLTNEVEMPNVFDYFISAGYLYNGLQVELNLMQQNTLGGDDIRRQDMPFVSNKMNYVKAGILAMYYLPKPKGFAVRGSVMTTLSGRNVGQSTTFMGGLLYTFKFIKN
ncbi:MAG: hypothetical protein ABI663_12455 [Chryseolinea sp.]